MEFENAFDLGVFDYNQPVGAHCDEGGGEEEIWNQRRMMEEPIIEKVWVNLTTECTEAFYNAFITGLFERMNPLRYTAQFDGCTLRLFEEGGGINILVDKKWTRSNIVYTLRKMEMKITSNCQHTVLERRYSVGAEVDFYNVQHEYVTIAVDPTEELKFSISVFAQSDGEMRSV